MDGWPLEIKEKGRKDVIMVKWFKENKFLDENMCNKIFP